MLSRTLNGVLTAQKCSLVASKRIARPLLSQRSLVYSRFLLNKKPASDDKGTKQSAQSILTDDMLFKAGVDIDEAGKNKAADGGVEASATAESSQNGDSPNGKTDGTKRRRKRQTSTDIKREKYASWFYIFTFSSFAGAALYMTRDWEPQELEAGKEGQKKNGYTPGLMYQRFRLRFNSMFNYFQEPPFPDLLPPPPPPPYQRPLTLVLTLEDFLVHSEWSQKHGWRTAKRPGTDYFLGYLSQYYEIVLFSSNYMMYSEKIAEKLDPIHAFVSYNLFKEHCYYKDGVHIKDLSKLNRDLNKVIIIDTEPASYQLQPENAIPVKPWDGKADDYLLRLIPFLEYMATQQVKDVKPILNSFKDKYEIPTEFDDRVAKLKSKFYNDEKAKSKGNWALKMLNIAGPAGHQKAKFPLDLIREEGEKNYAHFMKLIEEEKEKIRIQQEQMGGQTFTLKDYVEGNIPSPEEQMQMQLEKQKEIDAMFEEQKKKKEHQQQ